MLYSILSLYFFIFIGYLSKKIYDEEVNVHSLNLLSVNFLQPMLVLWGFTRQPLSLDIISISFWYLFILIFSSFLLLVVSFYLFRNKQDRSIFIISPIIGNTGNLGIPLGLVIFGESSLSITTMINVTTAIFAYTFGTFYYSNGKSSVQESLKKIVKLPIIWAIIISIIINLNFFEYMINFRMLLDYAGHTSMVIQLMLFGMFLNNITLKSINMKLLSSVILIKFILLPILIYYILTFVDLPLQIKYIMLMQILMPIAIVNISLSALFNCGTGTVTAAVFITSFLFLFINIITPTLLNIFGDNILILGLLPFDVPTLIQTGELKYSQLK